MPQPQAGPNEVVVRVGACGICGTDQHIFEGDFFPTYPLIGGHELAGEVTEIGADVETVGVGDRVAVDPGIFCGYCYFCQRAQGNHCLNWQAIGVTRSGGFAEYVVAPKANIYPIGDMPFETAACIEPISCVVYGLRRLKIATGSTVLIFGAGSIGLLMLQLVRHGGGSAIAMVDVKEEKLALARQLGAQHTVLARERVHDDLRDLAPLGFDVVIDCTGLPHVAEGTFQHARPEGKVLLFGVNPPEATIALSPYLVYRKDLEIYGSFALRYTFHQAIDLIRAGTVTVEPLLTHRLPIERFAEGLALARSGEALKVQIHPQ
jgi:2-desacetyl-2-hydroxyethyl bacteriochlorophyllide A dehydrogenase